MHERDNDRIAKQTNSQEVDQKLGDLLPPKAEMARLKNEIERQLKRDANQLIDTSLRNRFLHLRLSNARGIAVKQERSENIYDILVKRQTAMTFAHRECPEEDGSEDYDLGIQPTEAQLTDSILNTDHAPKNLQTRLVNTYRAARGYFEERGSNVLFLALGVLHWEDHEGAMRRAPLIMVPVILERANVENRFRVRYSGAEIELNIALSRRLYEDHKISLPTPSIGERFSPKQYFRSIARALDSKGDSQSSLKYSLEQNEIELTLLSYSGSLLREDLNPDVWPEQHKPTEHDNLLALLGFGATDGGVLIPVGERIDQHIDPVNIFDVMSADSSQQRLLEEIRAGKSLVVQGGPGTGKSITIANMLINAVAQGKRVLFVAEKTAALEVVMSLLDRVGLRDLCLDLHHPAVSKKAVLNDIKCTCQLGSISTMDRADLIQTLTELTNRLNHHCDLLATEVRKTGCSPYQAIGWLISSSDQQSNLIDLGFDGMREWSAQDYREVRSQIQLLQRCINEMGMPATHMFFGSKKDDSITNIPEIKKLIGLAYQAAIESRKSALFLGEQLGLPLASSRQELNGTAAALARIYSADGIRLALREAKIDDARWQLMSKEIETAIEAGKNYNAIRNKFDGMLLERAWRQDLEITRRDLNLYGRKWTHFGFNWSRWLQRPYREANQTMRNLCSSYPPKKLEAQLELLDAVITSQKERLILMENAHHWGELFGNEWRAENSNWQALETLAQWCLDFNASHSQLVTYPDLVSVIKNPEVLLQNYDQVAKIQRNCIEVENAFKRVLTALDFDPAVAEARFDKLSISDLETILGGWHDNLAELRSLVSYNQIAQRCRRLGADFIVEQVEHWSRADQLLLQSFDYTWFQGIANEALAVHPVLARFNRMTHQQVVGRFAQLDTEILHANAAEVAQRHWSVMPRINVGGLFGDLLKEFRKKTARIPIRQLHERFDPILRKIKPITIASPITVAQFLPRRSSDYDLVVFDEGSQIKPVSAYGAIARAKQFVICGDSEQLPPTTFFDALITDETKEENSLAADVESILEMAIARGFPVRTLDYYYRGKPALIAASNLLHYDGRLRYYPSPTVGHNNDGVFYHHIENGVYDRGGSRINRIEAQAVADTVMRHAHTRPDKSLGVVTFNRPQAELIENLVEKARRADPSCEEFFCPTATEPFIVKNLENIQGDERAVILISTGYGRDQAGELTLNFGPISQAGGDRRINVVSTRPREERHWFTSLNPDDLPPEADLSPGVKALRTHLLQARDGVLDVDSAKRHPKPDSLQIYIKEKLEKRSYEIRTEDGRVERRNYEVDLNVGQSGVFIDLAVIDPDNPNRYILGIRTDGAQYQNSESARDRDHLQDQILTNRLGWEIERVWILDWMADPLKEVGRLEQRLSEIRTSRGDAGHVAGNDAVELFELTRAAGQQIDRGAGASRYKVVIPQVLMAMARVGGQLVPERIQSEDLKAYIMQVARGEAPIHKEELFRRVRGAVGLERKNEAFEQKLEMACNLLIARSRLSLKDQFCYLPTQRRSAQAMIEPRDRSALDTGSKKFKYICPEEIRGAIHYVVKHACGILSSEVSKSCMSVLGFRSTSRAAEEIIEHHCSQLSKEGLIVERDGLLFLT